jgi:hypothetical protein
VKTINGKCTYQVEILRSPKSPKNQFPVIFSAFVNYSEVPYRFEKCLNIRVIETAIISFYGPVIFEKCKDTIVIVFMRINRLHNFSITLQKVVAVHNRDEIQGKIGIIT